MTAAVQFVLNQINFKNNEKLLSGSFVWFLFYFGNFMIIFSIRVQMTSNRQQNHKFESVDVFITASALTLNGSDDFKLFLLVSFVKCKENFRFK